MSNYTLVKEKVCAECYDHSAERDRCICWSERNYETIEIEFKQCNCCGNIDHDNIPYTPFNRQQLGDRFFEEEIAEETLQARINSFTYQIDSFRGGDQKVNEVESAVRVTCIETGKVVECSEHRSRYQNIEQAKRMLNENDNN